MFNKYMHSNCHFKCCNAPFPVPTTATWKQSTVGLVGYGNKTVLIAGMLEAYSLFLGPQPAFRRIDK